MNTHGLARYYDCLSPRERFPLIVAARSRGDEAEAERLIHSAPTTLHRVPHYRGLAEALGELSLLHLCQLLHLVALLGQTEGWLHSTRGLVPQGEPRERRELRILQGARLYAYLFLVETEGWNHFCAELNLDPEVLVREVPGYTTVKLAAETARDLACTLEEAAEAVRLQRGDTALVPTVETTLAGYRKALAARENGWT